MRPLILGEGVIDDAADLADMIARTALNDRAAFRRLYNVSSSKLFAVALRILKDRTEAEDALQDIYVKIWNRADRFAGDGTSPMGWLVAVARNHSIDRLRARRTGHSDIDKHADIADPGRSPESEAIAASERSRLDGCIEQLEEAKANSVRAAYLDGYSYQELADRHAVPLNTMRTWLRRSLIKLRECLEA